MLNQWGFPNLHCLHHTGTSSRSAEAQARCPKLHAPASPTASWTFPGLGSGERKVRNEISAGSPFSDREHLSEKPHLPGELSPQRLSPHRPSLSAWAATMLLAMTSSQYPTSEPKHQGGCGWDLCLVTSVWPHLLSGSRCLSPCLSLLSPVWDCRGEDSYLFQLAWVDPLLWNCPLWSLYCILSQNFL